MGVTRQTPSRTGCQSIHIENMALGTGGYAKKKNAITLGKALATFGFETWSSLDKDDEENSDPVQFKRRLDNLMYEKSQVIENKRTVFVKRQMEIENMDDGALKKRLLYSQDVILDRNSVNQEERELHEAYQFCIREYECRHKDIDLSSISLSLSDPETPVKKTNKKKKDRRRSAEVCSMYRGK